MRKRPDTAPITSKADFKRVDERRKEINRLNRQRAKAMEKRVARYLDGTQTPQSGAGSAKGDILIDFRYRPGKYMIECKMSALLKNSTPKFQLTKAWIPKMIKDAKAMRALFPILVYHYHDKSGDFVVIACEDLHKINVYPEKINDAEPEKKSQDTDAKSIVILYPWAEICKKPPYYSLLSINSVLYYHMTLEYFRDIVKEV